MKARRRRFSLFAAIAGSLTMALFLGAAERSAADTTTKCPESGKSICVSITDQAKASISLPGSDHYLADFVTVSNDGTSSTLVNITVTITWKDLGVATTTSEYRQAFSDSRCTPVPDTPLTLTCTAPKSLRPGEIVEYGPLVFRTATDTNATDTELTIVAGAKEQDVDKKGKNPPVATVSASNPTPYEGSPDEDVSWAGEGLAVTLATTASSAGQFSKLPVPATLSPSFATLTETDCPTTEATCIGQKVTTQALGISPVNLQIFYTGPLPPGLTTGNLVVVHNGLITRACSGAFFTTPTDLSTAGACRRVSIDRSGPGDPRVIVDAWDISNGDWKWG